MKKLIFLYTIFSLISSTALANNWDLSAHGLAGAYYGFSKTKYENKYPSRLVIRTDATLKANYVFDKTHKLGIHASTTAMFREDDKDRRWGEYRFYPFIVDESQYGTIQIGYTQNAAYQLHKGAKEITFLKVDDSNATYFLSNPNWSNGFKSTAHFTPKSTSIMTDGRAPKIVYISPSINGFKFGTSYTVHNANRRGMTSRYADYETNEDGYTFAAQKEFVLSKNSKLTTSLGYGVFNSTDKEISTGVNFEYAQFNMGAGYKKAYIDGNKNPISTKKVNEYLPAYYDNYRESQAWSISAGYKWEKFKTNLAFLHTQAENTRHQDSLFIFSNAYMINDYIELYGVGTHLNAHSTTHTKDNKGCSFITGVAVVF